MSLTTCPRCGWHTVVHDHPPPRAAVCLACGWLELTDEDENGREDATEVAEYDTYLIWSHEHGGRWWGPGRCGYVRRMSQAGRYTGPEALDICARAIPGTSQLIGALPEIPVRLDHLKEMVRRYKAEFPGRDSESWE